jgi:hypothetical protein
VDWTTFFGPGNDVKWQHLQSPAGAHQLNALKPFISLVDERAPVAMLPRVDEHGHVRWYVGWRGEGDARFARDLLAAFLGRTYADLRDPPRLVAPSDPVETVFCDEFAGNALVVKVSQERRATVRARLVTMARCLLARPTRRASRLRSVGRILRDVEFALQQGDGASASAAIEELRAGGHLDAANIEFLNFRKWAAERAWTRILSHPELPHLMEVAAPRRAREAVIQAIYHTVLAPQGVLPNAEEWLRRLEHDVLPVYSPVFGSTRGFTVPEAAVCLAALPLVRRQPRDEAVDRALSQLEDAGWNEAAVLVRQAWDLRQPAGGVTEPVIGIPQPAALSWQDRAAVALGDDEVDLAYQFALAAERSRDRALMLVRCAVIMGDADATLEALSAWEALGADERAVAVTRGRVSAFVNRLYERAGRLTAPSPVPVDVPPARPIAVGGWKEWFRRLRDADPWPGATSSADAGQRTWAVASILDDQETVSEIVATIGATLPPWAADALRLSLPFLQEAFVTTPLDPRAVTMVDSLFDLLATDESHSVPTCEALIAMANGRVSLGATKTRYGEMLDAVVAAVHAVGSPSVLPTLIRALEMLIATPSVDGMRRQDAAIRLLHCTIRWWHRVSRAEQLLLGALASELDVQAALTPPEVAPDESAVDDPWDLLKDKYIAFYSLDASALKRTAQLLQQLCPSVRIATFEEHVATTPMQEAAKRADLFVLATKSAKHAATTFIETFLDSGRVAYATGKGSSSMVQAVRAWLGAKIE